MWAALNQLNVRMVKKIFFNATCTLDPDGAAHSFTAIWHAPHQEYVAGEDGAVNLCSVDPTVDVILADVPILPQTRDILTVAVQAADGTYTTAIRYQIAETKRDGYGKMLLRLVAGE